jgi:F-type H+-transporting ATPase subunit b
MELLKTLGVDFQQILVHAIGFLILLTILKRFAWGKLLSAMQARSDRIAEEFQAIEEAKQELDRLKAEYQAHLAKIEEEARAKLQESVREGRRIASEIEEEARIHARQTLEKAKEAIAQEMAKAKVELKEQVVDLAIQVTHKVLRQYLDEETDRRIIEGFIREIETLER